MDVEGDPEPLQLASQQHLLRDAVQSEEGTWPGDMEAHPTGLFRIVPSRDVWLLVPSHDAGLKDLPTQTVRGPIMRAFQFERTIPSGEGAAWFPLYLRCRMQSHKATPSERLIAIPPLYSTHILLHLGADVNMDHGPIIRAAVPLGNAGAAALLGYMRGGALNSARRIAPRVMESVTWQQKDEDPTSAAVAGYYQVLMGGSEQEQQDWLWMVADRFSTFPDGAIVLGTHLLNQADGGGTERLDKARYYLIEAVNRGIPIYTMGLRLLFDGLRRLIDKTSEDAELRAALARVRVAAVYADWHSATTSFEIPETVEGLPLRISAGS